MAYKTKEDVIAFILRQDKGYKKSILEAIIKSFPNYSYERKEVWPDSVCSKCLADKTEGTCWSCYESPAKDY